MIHAITSVRYVAHFLSKPTSTEDIAKALGAGGPLELSVDNALVILLPDACEPIAGSEDKSLDLIDVQAALLAGMLLAPDLAQAGVHWAVGTARLAQCLKDLDDAGFDWTPVKGEAATAIPKASARLTLGMRSLPTAKRTLVRADCIWDSDPQDAKTGTWYDHLTPAMLMAGDARGMEVLAQMMLMLPDAMSASGKGRGGGRFKASIAQMAASVGRDISALPGVAQAAAIAAWAKRTNPSADMAAYISDPFVEIERRAADTPAARYEPLFAAGWRNVAELHKLWPDDLADPVTATAALANNLGVGGIEHGLTPQAITALVTTLRELTAFAVSADNDARTREVVRAYKLADTHPDKTQVEAKAQLQSDEGYQALLKEAETIPLAEHVRFAKAMLQAAHGAGMLFLNGKLTNDKVWKERGGSRTDSALQSVFNEAVSIGTDDVAAEWGCVLPEGTAKRFISYGFQMDWWATFKAVIAKREGGHVADKISARLKGKPSQAVYSDSEAMRLLEKPARNCVELFMPGKSPESFASLWRRLTRLAASIDGMPAWCAPATGLRTRLEAAATQLMSCVAQRGEAMLATPATVIRKLEAFTIDGQAKSALDTVESHVQRIRQELEDGLHDRGLSADPGGEGHLTKKQKQQAARDERNTAAALLSLSQRAGKDEWGAAARMNGILGTEDGKSVAFGNRCSSFETAPDLQANCVACFAPAKEMHGRNKWCISPDDCWATGGENAHARVGVTDEQCRTVEVTDSSPISWSELVTTICARQPAPTGGIGGGRGGGGGKGAGKGAGKGKGAKGKGTKGIGKGGKGKGKGKGGSPFARQ
tara:strand:+ start:147 stop:2618 length:2472 start_codon:yes stop_codon:yes gene_type:complete